MRTTPHKLTLIDAIRTISRSAHAWRDRAADRYSRGRYKAASAAKRRKEKLYALKERGIAQGFREEVLLYVGRSPQGMAIYAYGEGGRACFHSCLHPAAAERPLVEDHPETLLVVAKRMEHRLCDAIFTLEALPEPGWVEFARSAPPWIKRLPIVCYECGGEGHVARDCPERYYEGDDFDDHRAFEM
jgi:hypothetical protein